MEKLSSEENILLEIYGSLTDPAAFSSPIRLFKRAQKLGHKNITLRKVQKFLRKLPFWQKYRPVRYQKNFPRSKMVFFALNR